MYLSGWCIEILLLHVKMKLALVNTFECLPIPHTSQDVAFWEQLWSNASTNICSVQLKALKVRVGETAEFVKIQMQGVLNSVWGRTHPKFPHLLQWFWEGKGVDDGWCYLM